MRNDISVNIGGVSIGDGHPTAVVAEIGTFFNQDIDLAKAYLTTIAQSGAQLFKTEILHDPTVCLETNLIHRYQHYNGFSEENYRQLIERKCVPLHDYESLFKLCSGLNLPYIATVYDFEGVEFLYEVGGSAIKIARDNINNLPLIRHSGKTGLPIIFDAGLVYIDEIALAIRNATSAGASGIIINHHPGSNPAPANRHNMRMIQKYKDIFNVPVGLACHYIGDELLYLSVGMGANIIEKGVVPDPTINEQDLISAAKLSELQSIVDKVNNCWEAIGSYHYQPEEPRDLSVRKGFIAKHRINKGSEITIDDLLFAWPPLGISVRDIDTLSGAYALNEIHAHQIISWSDIDFKS